MRKTEIGGFPALTVDGRHGRPLVLFIHGSFSTHEPFSRWLTVCEKSGWRAAVAARRGRLDLDPPCADGLTIADYLDDTRRVIDALGERPILIGHSLGGLIAQKLAEEDRAAALVLLAPVPAMAADAASRCVAGSCPDAAQHPRGTAGASELLERRAADLEPRPTARSSAHSCLAGARIGHRLPRDDVRNGAHVARESAPSGARDRGRARPRHLARPRPLNL
ncbi:MAG: alpha/beta hydrolase [Xanthobacteraceae bacterium]